MTGAAPLEVTVFTWEFTSVFSAHLSFSAHVAEVAPQLLPPPPPAVVEIRSLGLGKVETLGPVCEGSAMHRFVRGAWSCASGLCKGLFQGQRGTKLYPRPAGRDMRP